MRIETEQYIAENIKRVTDIILEMPHKLLDTAAKAKLQTACMHRHFRTLETILQDADKRLEKTMLSLPSFPETDVKLRIAIQLLDECQNLLKSDISLGFLEAQQKIPENIKFVIRTNDICGLIANGHLTSAMHDTKKLRYTIDLIIPSTDLEATQAAERAIENALTNITALTS